MHEAMLEDCMTYVQNLLIRQKMDLYIVYNMRDLWS